jgi:hypothetical protein
MIVNYFNLMRSVIAPFETDAPLVVDPDGMLAGPAAPQRFQALRHDVIHQCLHKPAMRHLRSLLCRGDAVETPSQ